MSSMLETKRATRGLRMADLVGQAADDDEQFWNNDVWNEDGSDADSFKSEDEELKPDEFDSDFNDSETEEEESDSDEENVKKAARAQTVKQSKASNVYKDPSAAVARAPAKRQLDQDGNPVQKRRTIDASMLHDGPLERSVRGSTKAKTQTTEEADKIRAKEQERAMKAKLAVDKPVRTGFKQKDLLAEALDTEETNAKWLVAQSFQESERAQADKPAKAATTDQYIRFSSRRGTYNTITFSSVEIVPDILNGAGAEEPPAGPQVCFITGLPAKYRDPRTLLPYATAEAFREIRRRYPSAASVMTAGRR